MISIIRGTIWQADLNILLNLFVCKLIPAGKKKKKSEKGSPKLLRQVMFQN